MDWHSFPGGSRNSHQPGRPGLYGGLGKCRGWLHPGWRSRWSGQPAAIVRAGTAALLIAVAFATMTCLLFVLANGPLISLYIQKDQEVIGLATPLLIIAGIFQISDGVQVAGLGIYGPCRT